MNESVKKLVASSLREKILLTFKSKRISGCHGDTRRKRKAGNENLKKGLLVPLRAECFANTLPQEKPQNVSLNGGHDASFQFTKSVLEEKRLEVFVCH